MNAKPFLTHQLLPRISALFCATLLLFGCQDAANPFEPELDIPVASETVGVTYAGKKPNCEVDPPHPSCKEDGGGGGAELDFKDGMVTTGFAVSVTESANQLKAENTDFTHEITMKFENPGTCVGFKGTKSGVFPTVDEITELKLELTRLVKSGFFIMKIDKTSLGSPSNGNLLDVERDGTFAGPTGSTRILLGSPFNQVAPVTVRQTDTDGFEFEWTGPVVVWASKVGGGGGAKSDRIIQCLGTGIDPNLVTVRLIPAGDA